MIRVLVVGADDAQTASVVRHLLGSGTFLVRALVREPACATAREMRRAGVEVVEGDLTDRAGLRVALRQVTAVFGVCCHEEDNEPQERLGRNLINACAGSDVEHVVVSDVTPLLETYARSIELPATFVRVIRTDEETFATTCLSGAISIETIEDLGAVLLPVFAAPAEFIGRTLLVAVTSQSCEGDYTALSQARIELSTPRLFCPPVGTWNQRPS